MEVCILYDNMSVQTPNDFKPSCNKVWIYNSSSFLFRFGQSLHNYSAPDSWLPFLLLWCFTVIWTTCHEAAAIDRFHRGMSSTEWLMHETFWWYLCKVKCSALNSHWSEGHQDMVESQNLVLYQSVLWREAEHGWMSLRGPTPWSQVSKQFAGSGWKLLIGRWSSPWVIENVARAVGLEFVSFGCGTHMQWFFIFVFCIKQRLAWDTYTNDSGTT